MKPIRSLYIHFPFCAHLCNYCDFYKQKLSDSDAQFDSFLKHLNESWPVHETFLKENNFKMDTLDTLYLGGGTPSLWGEKGARLFFEWRKKIGLNLAPQAEFTFEVDPGTCNEESLDLWHEMGVNRFSVGMQAFNNDMLGLLDRQHDVHAIKILLNYLKCKNFNFSVDFLIGAPEKVERKILDELKQVLEFAPNHISLYILQARKAYPQKKLIPGDERVAREYLAVCDFLAQNGFNQYEVSNFARNGFESVHNKVYWKAESCAALGPNATGFLRINTSNGLRYQWKTQKTQMEVESLDEKAMLLETTYLALRTSAGLNVSNLIGDPAKIDGLINYWQGRDLVKSYKNQVVTLNSSGFLILDSLMNDFFAQGLL